MLFTVIQDQLGLYVTSEGFSIMGDWLKHSFARLYTGGTDWPHCTDNSASVSAPLEIDEVFQDKIPLAQKNPDRRRVLLFPRKLVYFEHPCVMEKPGRLAKNDGSMQRKKRILGDDSGLGNVV